jgi:FkbM family methyltransferase
VNLTLLGKRVTKTSAALRSPDYRAALRRRVLPALEHAPVLSTLPPIRSVLDVGGNVGQFALVARHVWPDARITSFEPLPQAAAKLRSMFAEDSRHGVVEIACSDAAGEAEFHVTAADDSSSLLPVADRQVSEFPGTSNVAVLTVPVGRLADVVPAGAIQPGSCLLKIDTQGTELAVVEGAAPVLDQISYVLVEVSFVDLYEGQSNAGELVERLAASGLHLRAAYDVKYSRHTGEPIQADVLFGRSPAGG